MNRAEAIAAMIIDKQKVTHPSFCGKGFVVYEDKTFTVHGTDSSPREFSVSEHMCKTNWTIVDKQKEQGIMKYSAGDVLVTPTNNFEFKILAVCGLLYGCSEYGEFGVFETWYTEDQIDKCTIKTEITKTDMSVSEIEKALGKAAGSLNVVAE